MKKIFPSFYTPPKKERFFPSLTVTGVYIFSIKPKSFPSHHFFTLSIIGLAQGLGKLGLGLRSHQKTKFSLRKKAPLFMVKMAKFL